MTQHSRQTVDDKSALGIIVSSRALKPIKEEPPPPPKFGQVEFDRKLAEAHQQYCPGGKPLKEYRWIELERYFGKICMKISYSRPVFGNPEEMQSLAHEITSMALYDVAGMKFLRDKAHLAILDGSSNYYLGSVKSWDGGHRDNGSREIALAFQQRIEQALEDLAALTGVDAIKSSFLVNSKSIVDMWPFVDVNTAHAVGEGMGKLLSPEFCGHASYQEAAGYVDQRFGEMVTESIMMQVDREAIRTDMLAWTAYVSGRIRGYLDATKALDWKSKYNQARAELNSEKIERLRDEKEMQALKRNNEWINREIAALRESVSSAIYQRDMLESQLREVEAAKKLLEAKLEPGNGGVRLIEFHE